MTSEERIDHLENRLEQLQAANEIMFGLMLNVMLDPRWKEVVDTPAAMAEYIRIAAGAREDQEDHIAAQMLNRVAGRLMD